jgi:hypothetical protein
MRFSAGISTPKSRGIILFQGFDFLALSLFVSRIFCTDHAYNILALHDFARFTKSFH